MMLEMPAGWRFGNPGELDAATANAFFDLVLRITAQGSSWSLIEHFKAKFTGSHSRSSGESWARTDLREAMFAARRNAPAFIDAFWTGCVEITASDPGVSVPDEHVVNAILAEHGEPYEVRPPKLMARAAVAAPAVQVPEIGMGERATTLILQSLDHADQLLAQGRSRQAVQEALWLLETVATAFEGRETGVGTVEGKYFNTIVRDLRRQHPGTVLSEALGWATKLHGFLSSPSGGGVRHGVSITAERDLAPHEAALFCNLTRSYIAYLLGELAVHPASMQ